MEKIFQDNIYLLPFLGYCILSIYFVFTKWEYISNSLTSDGKPSALRLSGFLFVWLCCTLESFYTFKTGVFETMHLLYFLIGIGLLYSLIKWSEVSLGKIPLSNKETKNDTEGAN